MPLGQFHTIPSNVIRFVSLCDLIDNQYHIKKAVNETDNTTGEIPNPIKNREESDIQLKVIGKI